MLKVQIDFIKNTSQILRIYQWSCADRIDDEPILSDIFLKISLIIIYQVLKRELIPYKDRQSCQNCWIENGDCELWIPEIGCKLGVCSRGGSNKIKSKYLSIWLLKGKYNQTQMFNPKFIILHF